MPFFSVSNNFEPFFLVGFISANLCYAKRFELVRLQRCSEWWKIIAKFSASMNLSLRQRKRFFFEGNLRGLSYAKRHARSDVKEKVEKYVVRFTRWALTSSWQSDFLPRVWYDCDSISIQTCSKFNSNIWMSSEHLRHSFTVSMALPPLSCISYITMNVSRCHRWCLCDKREIINPKKSI